MPSRVRERKQPALGVARSDKKASADPEKGRRRAVASAASHSTAPGVLATCREAQPLGPEDRDPYQGCIRDEGQARAELQRQWAQFDPANRTSCVEETGIGGPQLRRGADVSSDG